MCGEQPEEAAVTTTPIHSREHDDGDENNDRNDDAFSIKAGLAREQRVTDVRVRFVDPRVSLPLLSFSLLLLLLFFFSFFLFLFFRKGR